MQEHYFGEHDISRCLRKFSNSCATISEARLQQWDSNHFSIACEEMSDANFKRILVKVAAKLRRSIEYGQLGSNTGVGICASNAFLNCYW